MYRRLSAGLVVSVVLFALAACTNKKVQNPIANLDSKQPDKVLFDRAMDNLKHDRFDVARTQLQTLINTYPDSEYVARAKLSVADSWYAEGSSAALAQAEAEYNDFKTFFPNMPEAAEAQMKIGTIHMQQMEKADRDFTHAKQAEEAYREMITEFPDSKLVPEAKEKLREVQEVLAEREFLIGRFYYLRTSYPAAMARLKSLTDTYPLFSGADEALFLLGDCYERQIANVRNSPRGTAEAKERVIKANEAQAADAYAYLLTRYPLSSLAGEAKRRLTAMHRPVPQPTAEALAQNKAELESRRRASMRARAMGSFSKHPDTSLTARVGDPTLQDPKPTDAPQILRNSVDLASGKTSSSSPNTVSAQTVGVGAPPPNQPAPRSDAAPAFSVVPPSSSEPPTASSTGSGDSSPVADSPASKIPELTPLQPSSVPAAASQSGNADSAPAPPPTQVNEAAAPADGSTPAASSGSSGDPPASGSSDGGTQSSSSQKKKGHKLIPF
jgi:outer membrane protein assembly factor BamD